jgi:hypothetical protein
MRCKVSFYVNRENTKDRGSKTLEQVNNDVTDQDLIRFGHMAARDQQPCLTLYLHTIIIRPNKTC